MPPRPCSQRSQARARAQPPSDSSDQARGRDRPSRVVYSSEVGVQVENLHFHRTTIAHTPPHTHPHDDADQNRTVNMNLRRQTLHDLEINPFGVKIREKHDAETTPKSTQASKHAACKTGRKEKRTRSGRTVRKGHEWQIGKRTGSRDHRPQNTATAAQRRAAQRSESRC